MLSLMIMQDTLSSRQSRFVDVESILVEFQADRMQRLLDHLKEVNFYSAKDLVAIENDFISMRDTLRRSKGTHSPHLLTLLSNRLDTCHIVLEELRAKLAYLSPDLAPTYEKLVSILRSMAASNTRSNVGLC